MTTRLIIAYGLVALLLLAVPLALAILTGRAARRRGSRRPGREHLRVDLFADRGQPTKPDPSAPVAP
jgi:hypothetical protein